MREQLLVNSIRTPDGKVLTSRHRHDFRGHTDRNGEFYFVDGGLEYQRRSVNKEPATNLTQVMTDDHEHNRQHACWGTRGEDGYEYRPVMSLSTKHIENIMRDAKDPHHRQLIANYIREIMEEELKYREHLQDK